MLKTIRLHQLLDIINTNQSAPRTDKIKALSFLEEQFHRLISENTVAPSRSYLEIKLQKLQGTYVSDGEKIDKILSEIKQLQETFSHTDPSIESPSQASQKGKKEGKSSPPKSQLRDILTQESEKTVCSARNQNSSC